MKSIKQFLDWVKSHPFKAVGFTCVFSVLPTAMALSEAFTKLGLALFGVLLSLFVLVLWLDTRKTVAILLAACLLFAGVRPAESHTEHTDGWGPIIVGIVVVVVGGVVIYKVVKFCQKKFAPTPPSTNAPPDDGFVFKLQTSTSDDAAASYSGSASDIYCWSEQWPADSDPESDDDDTCDQIAPPMETILVGAMPYTPSPLFLSESLSVPAPTPTDLNAFEVFGNLSGVHVRPMEKTNGVPALLDAAEFYRVLATHGISYFEGGGGVAFYGRGGQPCAPDQCPIQFIQVPGKRLPDVVISNGKPTHQLAIQRSADLSNWVTMFRSAVPEGLTVRCEDISRRTKGFYRIVTE